MARFFKDKISCRFCAHYLESPVYLKCGYICCLRCTEFLEKNPQGKGILCPSCTVISLKEDILPAVQLEHLITKIKRLEPQMNCSLKLNPRIKIFQVNLTLDLDSAHNRLIISEDLRSVYCGSKQQDRKECADRFQISTCVLGSSRFTSGRHYWEVVVGTSKEWDIGICKESVNREKPINLTEGHGFWTVGVRNGEVYEACTEPLTKLIVNPRLHRVGIFLDLVTKNVSFWDLSDDSHIFTFFKIPDMDPFRPFFAPSNSYPDDQDQVLTICPVLNPGIFRRRPVNPY
ncbi:ret finger protein-like 4A [Phodopus roborovskii]|uniref:Rfpl4a protein n=1 Tax=Phodopus roborovskii TaxID=109678 RepID=A0AAV0A8P5_PHORO|nr:ret finger protein-like 4A [Phodopus roborovskii]CAH7404730.1 Rfpl4a [Phodopus roborovskii]